MSTPNREIPNKSSLIHRVIFTNNALIILILSMLGSFSAYASDALAVTPSTAVVCIKGVIGPSTRPGYEGCFEPIAFETSRSRLSGSDGELVSTVTMAVDVVQAPIFQRMLSADPAQPASIQICIFEGAHICLFPYVLLQSVCITTNQLAGTTCPYSLNGKPEAVISFRSANAIP